MSKGKLSEAISNWIEESPIATWLNHIYIEFVDKLEDLTLGVFSPLLERIPRESPFYTILNPSFIRANRSTHAGVGPALITFVLALGAAIGNAVAGPYVRIIQAQVDKVALSYRLQLAELTEHFRRGYKWDSTLDEEYRQLGIDESRQRFLEALSHNTLNINLIYTLYYRGIIDKPTAIDRLCEAGFKASDASNILTVSENLPGISDLIHLMVRDAWNEDAVKKFGYDDDYPREVEIWAGKQGINEAWVKRYWRAHWQLPSPMQGYEMMHRLRPGKTENPFTSDDLSTLLRINDYPKYFRERLEEISYNPFTRVDVRRMYKTGILDYAGVVSAYQDIGYKLSDATKLADFTVKYETSSDGDSVSEYKDDQKRLLETAYVKQVIDEVSYRAKLKELGYSEDVVNIIVQVVNTKISLDHTPELYKEHQKDVQSLIEQGYTRKYISRTEAISQLKQVGYQDDDINYILEAADYNYNLSVKNKRIARLSSAYLSNNISENQFIGELGAMNLTGEEQGLIIGESRDQKLYSDRKLTEAQYRAAWGKGIINEAQYRMHLDGLGYIPSDINIMVELYKK